jgi:hypothetical protein
MTMFRNCSTKRGMATGTQGQVSRLVASLRGQLEGGAYLQLAAPHLVLLSFRSRTPIPAPGQAGPGGVTMAGSKVAMWVRNVTWLPARLRLLATWVRLDLGG